MTYGHHLKRTLAISVLFFSSCTSSARSWTQERIDANFPQECSIMLLEPENPFHNLEIELQKQEESIVVYLNVHGTPITPLPDRTYPVIFDIDDQIFTYHAHVFEGNQRLLLPEKAQQQLLESLNREAKISIRAGKYHTDVTYEGFKPMS
jgi:hypothetical protein